MWGRKVGGFDFEGEKGLGLEYFGYKIGKERGVSDGGEIRFLIFFKRKMSV